MGKFTSEDLMKAMGLSVGDRIKVDVGNKIITYEIAKHSNGSIFLENPPLFDMPIPLLAVVDFSLDYDLISRPKRVGELDCFVEMKCNNCPLRMISNCTNKEGIPLYDILQEIKMYLKKENMFDQEIYDLLKARLDKEVE